MWQLYMNKQSNFKGGGFICRNFFLFDISWWLDSTASISDIVDTLRDSIAFNEKKFFIKSLKYIKMVKKTKARTTIVRLVSSAGTGYFFTRIRPRQLPKLSFVKYDPKVGRRVLFTEQKNR
ncbi:ribosomal protein L33 [Rhizophagus clarus]|uniref:Large ribosomal subunit protein bL33m n=1 Tax=Rhizophagus clarus TaxID=94130 RepID=A0A8H3LJZ0_9GLOM|nr:ribosomal protein L33 [Rhizophagus clarus]